MRSGGEEPGFSSNWTYMMKTACGPPPFNVRILSTAAEASCLCSIVYVEGTQWTQVMGHNVSTEHVTSMQRHLSC